MKKLFSIIALSLVFNFCYSQTDTTNIAKTDTSYHIIKMVDDMTDKVYYMSNYRLVLANEQKTQGFTIELNLDGKSDDRVSASGFSVKMVDIGSCCENNELILLFEDGTKLSFKSWNKFNCEGNAWFFISKKDIEILSSKKVTKARIENGRTHDSFTKEVPEEKQDYFIQVMRAISEKRIKEKKGK